MRQRPLGRTGLSISEISFGCGNVGGLLIRGGADEQRRAVERAIGLGITYFDTAAAYGDGVSERNLGKVLAEIDADVLIGTKLRISQSDMEAGPARIRSLFDESLSRLGRDRVDLLYYHGRIMPDASPDTRALSVSQVLGPLLDAMHDFQREDRVRFLGFTGLGDTRAVLDVAASGRFDVAHCYFSAANPSAGYSVPPSFAPQDLGQLIDVASAAGTGALAIRILAAGALAGTDRHPLAGGTDGVLVTGTDYREDARLAERLRPLAHELGISLAELGIRFALSKRELATALVGISAIEQVDFAVRAAEAGPLPEHVVDRVVQTVIAV